jgi:hypothetical protein
LAEVIRDLTQRNEDLAAAAAFWQIRAQEAEAESASETQESTGEYRAESAQKPAPAAPGSTESDDPPVTGIRRWWNRWRDTW